MVVANTMFCVFPNSEDAHVATFDVDQCLDIANYGMRQGVSGFIYTKDNVAWFDENSDEIEEYLSDFYHDNMGVDNYIQEIAQHQNPGSIEELQCAMVWAYVELKCGDWLMEIHHPDYC